MCSCVPQQNRDFLELTNLIDPWEMNFIFPLNDNFHFDILILVVLTELPWVKASFAQIWGILSMRSAKDNFTPDWRATRVILHSLTLNILYQCPQKEYLRAVLTFSERIGGFRICQDVRLWQTLYVVNEIENVIRETWYLTRFCWRRLAGKNYSERNRQTQPKQYSFVKYICMGTSYL